MARLHVGLRCAQPNLPLGRARRDKRGAFTDGLRPCAWRRLGSAVLSVCLALVGTPALAHKLKVYAFADGARIEGSAYFAGGGKAAGARILFEDGEGRTLAELTPGLDGRFAFEAKAPVDHLIVAESPDGHRAEWRISAAELAGGFPGEGAARQPQPGPGLDAGPPGQSSTAAAAPPVAGSVLDPALETAIERAVARQVRPLREELIAAQDALRLRDVLGAVGYIFGLAGLGFWWHARRSGGGQ